MLLRLPPLVEAKFIDRPNRFSAVFECGGRTVTAHVANSGRLGELLAPENPMFLSAVDGSSGRKTSHDLVLVQVSDVLVSADARLPNLLVKEAIESRRLPELSGYDLVRSEVTLERSRIDLLLSRDGGPLCFMEIKSVTLVEDGVGLFPDSPTERGRRHVGELAVAAQRGMRAAVVFVVQREDVDAFEPNRRADLKLCEALDLARRQGVEVYARRCRVSQDHVELADSIPVRLG